MRERTCFIHIGMHKTGSTSIQRALHGLENSSIRYLSLGEPNHSKTFLAAYNQKSSEKRLEGKQKLLSILSRSKLGRDGVVEEIDADDRDVIISGEGLSRHFDRDAVGALFEDLQPRFDRFSIVAYIREPRSHIVSIAQQILRSSPKSLESAVQTLEYRRYFLPWMEIFGQDNVKLIPFNRMHLKNGDVVCDYFYRVGLDYEGMSARFMNASPTAETVILCNRFTRQIAQLRPFSAERLRLSAYLRTLKTSQVKFGRHKFALGSQLLDDRVLESADHLSWLEPFIGDPFAEYSPSDDCMFVESDAHMERLGASLEKQFKIWWQEEISYKERSARYGFAIGRQFRG